MEEDIGLMEVRGSRGQSTHATGEMARTLNDVVSYATGDDAADVDVTTAAAVRTVSADYTDLHTLDASYAGDDVAAADAIVAPTGDDADAAVAAGAVHTVSAVYCLTQRLFLPRPPSPSRMLLPYRAVPR